VIGESSMTSSLAFGLADAAADDAAGFDGGGSVSFRCLALSRSRSVALRAICAGSGAVNGEVFCAADAAEDAPAAAAMASGEECDETLGTLPCGRGFHMTLGSATGLGARAAAGTFCAAAGRDDEAAAADVVEGHRGLIAAADEDAAAAAPDAPFCADMSFCTGRVAVDVRGAAAAADADRVVAVELSVDLAAFAFVEAETTAGGIAGGGIEVGRCGRIAAHGLLAAAAGALAF
jgi:hypothetical protein